MLGVLPLCFILIGLVFYVVLAGADFGAGIWQLLSGPGDRGRALRDQAVHSVGPVWEANHVWLIFVVTVSWTAYPKFLGSVASTLAVPLFATAIGVILRGAGYALRPAARPQELTLIDGLFGTSSLLCPFALGCAAGALAVERVPVGNATGAMFGSWTAAVPLLVGAMSVCFCAYLAAVYMAADCHAHGHDELVAPFRRRALISGAVAGTLAIVGLVVIHGHAPGLYHGLTHGAALVVAIISILSGIAVIGLVLARRFAIARFAVGVPIATLISAWALARYPTLLPGLSVQQAAAPHDTLVCVVVAVLAGGLLLFPALGVLFSLALGGGMQPSPAAPDGAGPKAGTTIGAPFSRATGIRLAIALLIAGLGLLNAADAAWAHAIGVVALLAFILVGAATVLAGLLAEPG